MELADFKKAVADARALLASLQKLLPDEVSDELLVYLAGVQNDPVALKLLRNSIAPTARS
jgi:hypothetical protein